MCSPYQYILLLITLCVTTTKCKKFIYDYTTYPGVPGQLKLHNIPAMWQDARMICDMEGAVLVSPSTSSMMNALDTIMQDAESEYGIFTGINSIYSKGFFYSIEGMPLGEMPLQWIPGQPDKADNNEDCIVYMDGGVADIKCSETLTYVCHRENIGTKPLDISCTEEQNKKRCLYVHFEERTWPDAYKICSAEGGHLAIITMKHQAEQVNSYTRRAAFVGVHDWSGRGDWRTVHGQMVDGSLWANGQPDNRGGEKTCGVVVNNRMASSLCGQTAPFVCEHFVPIDRFCNEP